MPELFIVTLESNDFSECTTSSNGAGSAMTTSAASAMAGTYGCACTVAGVANATAYLSKDTTVATADLRFRFYFDPNSLTMANKDQYWLAWLTCDGTLGGYDYQAGIRHLYTTANGHQLQIMIRNDAGAETYGTAFNITDASHYVEVHVKQAATSSPADGRMRIWVDGTLKDTLSSIDNSHLFTTLSRMCFGFFSGVDAGTSGTIYIDDIVVDNDEYEIGPYARTLYVNPDSGNDSNTGNSGSPWAHIEFAALRLHHGDTLKVAKAANASSYATGFRAANVGLPSARITIVANDTGKMPVIANTSAWILAANYWTISYIEFNGWKCQGAVHLGNETGHVTATGVTVSNCIFRHSIHEGIQVQHAISATIQDCLFRDIRSRAGGTDMNAINFRYSWSSVLVHGCDFEDIGSDAIHVESRGGYVGGSLTVEYCHFFVNRPYKSKSWQDYSTNVSENAMDLKEGGAIGETGPITVQYCVIDGYYATVAGQDASGAQGEGVCVHMNLTNVTFESCLFYDCTWGIFIGRGIAPYTTAGGTINHCTISHCDSGIRLSTTANPQVVTIHGSYIQDSTTYHLSAYNVDNLAVNNNIFVGGNYNRGTQHTEAFTTNTWAGGATQPAQWQSATDLKPSTLGIHKLDTLSNQSIEVQSGTRRVLVSGLDHFYNPALIRAVVARVFNGGITVAGTLISAP